MGLRWLAATLLSLTVLLCGAWSVWPSAGPAAPTNRGPSPTNPAGALQEVAPPLAVQQVQALLAERQPRLRILSPANDAMLPAGPWDLELEIDDWPLVGPGPLGIGPHLVVQLDQQEPLRLSDPPSDGLAPVRLHLTMAPLRPGSHRLSVYAAKPWGEAVKSAGGFRQVRLHRAAVNPAELPVAGSAQLISAIPFDQVREQPVPIDWLLVDAPLQRLRDDDRHWLLRVTVNGDSFLVDRQTTVWLTGLRQGGNAVQLELLDSLGDSLNPPYNSLVEEVTLAPEGDNRWLQGTLSAAELDQILGRAAAEPMGPNATSLPLPTGESPEPTVADAAEPDPANSDSAEEPPAQPDQHVEPVTAESDPPQRQDPETSAETDAVVLSNEAVVPPDAAGNGLDRPDDKLS
ncbi:hypothetical protein KQ302_13385 [Synechococcus sp. CS-602]|uniref:hypothetical protein n=1 Tax=Synechococcaceae TaxID=1890426 RepID=UPI0011A753D2|nr:MULTISPECIES: hypothetical protein [Synechococcaceae]MCT4365314.1 hypothetical protein [Candidatus Regnicoccus frigidus MAG-AL1]MCT0201574.1 hypothetical protein [Synechococcus sp. CS-603]MCT0206081.1 hypothetical protein [Synechococcus sp. CS-602]MCT0245005.1 hypothetical protein [Synechococcus sp. CS-601]MCT4367154.1 hypothetical protein [Candidatus Regnicoccus frigidus MAG-AL2]